MTGIAGLAAAAARGNRARQMVRQATSAPTAAVKARGGDGWIRLSTTTPLLISVSTADATVPAPRRSFRPPLTPPPTAHHQRRETDGLAIVPKLVEALEVAVGDKSVGTKARPELIGEELPLRKSSLSIGPYLDGLGARPDVHEAHLLQPPRERASVARRVAVADEQSMIAVATLSCVGDGGSMTSAVVQSKSSISTQPPGLIACAMAPSTASRSTRCSSSRRAWTRSNWPAGGGSFVTSASR